MKWTLTGIIVLCFLVLIIASSALAAPSNDHFVSFIDVGQGDSALIQDPSGFTILIDGGKSSAGPTVVAYLRNQGVSNVDVMVASHADSDHIGGLIDVLNASDITVQEVLYNGYPGSTTTWTNFVAAVASEGASMAPAQFPQSYTWGSASAHILNPEGGLTSPDQNDASVVVLLDYGSVEYLFTGDIDTTVEATVVARGTPVAAEVLKVGHHGSRYSSSDQFLAAVQPDEAVISVGNNQYGHPTIETINRLLAAGANVWRTDQVGTITIISDGQTYSILSPQTTPEIFLPIILKALTQSPSPSPTTPSPSPTTPSPSPTTPSPSPTTPSPSPTTPSPSPTTPSPPPTTGNVEIFNIFVDGAGSSEPDEHVDIRNNDNKGIQLSGWTLRDNANHIFTFPSFVIQPGQECRVYTNEHHAQWCGFNYGSGSAIWNNSGDCAFLKDSTNQDIDQYCY